MRVLRVEHVSDEQERECSGASPVMIDDQESSFPLRFPFSTTFTPSGAMVMVYVFSPCTNSRLIDLSSFVAMPPSPV